MSRRSRARCAWLVAAAGALGPIVLAGEPIPTLVLPEPSYQYADPDLPSHFRTKLVRAFDNTPNDNPLTDDGATLGRVLFYDTRLSADGTLSCASCHVQKYAFADPERFSKGVGGRRGDRNAPSLVNARFVAEGRFFWDGRAATLERQVLEPIANPREMAQDVDRVVEVLRREAAYARLCARAFGDRELTSDRIAKALAQFVRALVSYRSKYDEGLARARSVFDDFANFTGRENAGKRIFLGEHDRGSRGLCASCHLPGFASPASQQAIFRPHRALNNGLDAEFVGRDNGLGDVSLDPADFGLFRSPDLRNVELTAPYMHDGRFATLEEVVEHYNGGVRPHPNLDPLLLGRVRRGRPPAPRPLHLNGKQKAELVAFLKTLTDRSFVTDPRFSDPFVRGAPLDSRPAAPGANDDPRLSRPAEAASSAR